MDNSPQGQVAQMLTGYWVSQMVYVAAKLDLAGLLHARPHIGNIRHVRPDSRDGNGFPSRTF
jgi:hypothetical protein